jgi:hypothetical protein
VQDYLHTILRAQMQGSEIFRCAETWNIPLDAFGNAWIGSENNLPDGENRGLERVIKRCEKDLDILRRGVSALGWLRTRTFRGHGALLNRRSSELDHFSFGLSYRILSSGYQGIRRDQMTQHRSLFIPLM